MTEDKIEEETYSLIFTSLKHPIRKRILRMLADKALTYSEILEILNIDSGHLSYHLENLGDLTVHSNNGQYKLSSFGVAAVKLMGEVEDQKIIKTNKETGSKLMVTKAYSIILALILIGVSLHFVTYSTLVYTKTNVTPIYAPRNILFNLASNETFEIGVNIEFTESYPDYVVRLGGRFDKWSFTIREPQQSMTSWDKATIWLEPENIQPSSTFLSSGTSLTIHTIPFNNQTSNEPHNVTLFLCNPINHTIVNNFSNIEIEIISPDGQIKNENGLNEINADKSIGFPSVQITQEGT